MSSGKNGKNVEICIVPLPESLSQEKEDQRKKFWHIDKEMLLFKIHYFLFTGAFGACIPYITIFAQKRIGISASALAAILTTQRCILIFTKPAIGYIADYFNKLKVTIFILSMVTTITLLVFLAIPKLENETEVVKFNNFSNNSSRNEILNASEAYTVCDFLQKSSSLSMDISFLNQSINNDMCIQSFLSIPDFLKQCTGNTKNDTEEAGNNTEYRNALNNKFLLCQLCCKLIEKCETFYCGDKKESKTKIPMKVQPISDFHQNEFWIFALISTISIACGNSLFTLTDTACCETVQKTGAQFGRQSLWGPIGWGFISPIGGLLNDLTGDFMASWFLMAVLALISLLNITKISMENPQFSKNLLKDIGTVLSSREFLAFKFCVIMNGVGTGIVWFYLVLFLTDIGGSRFLCGMVMFTQCFCGEIPFMFFSGWIIRKIGHFNVVTLSLTAYAIRYLFYSQIHNPWLVLPVEILQGFTEGLFYTNVASFAKLSSKPGTEATTQGVLSTAHEGIGIGIGCLIAGLGFDSIGCHRTFLYVSIYSFCAAVLSIILHLLVRRQKRNINVSSSTNM